MPKLALLLRAIAPLALASLLSACSTLGSLISSDYQGLAIYGGVYDNARSMRREASESDIDGMVALAIDFPFSLVADTVLLPLTIPMQLRASDGQAAQAPAETGRWAPSAEGARAFVESCFALAREFDARYVDCYGDDSRISYRGARDADLSGAEFRDLLKRSLPAAKLRGDRSIFRDLRIEPEGSSFRVRATRYSELYAYESPWEALVGADSTGAWRILRETVEVRR